MTVSNVTAVQQIYAAFGRGDIPAIVEKAAENTHWDFNGHRSEIPWHTPVDGRAELPKFFEAFGTNVEMHGFEPGEFMHCGPHVLVNVHVEFSVNKTARRVSQDQLHWWTFDDQARVLRLRQFEDTAQVLAAVTGE